MAKIQKKPSLGRQKIKIAKIEKSNHRQVTFSKRRSGLFKKACELCTLCGVEIAIVVFSPARKVFSFGHPNVDSLVDKFLNSNKITGGGMTKTSACADARVEELNAELTRAEGLLEAERERKEALERVVAEWWWEGPVGRMGREELERLSASLEELKESVALRAKMLDDETTSFHGVDNYTKMKMEELMPAGYGIGCGFGGF